MTGRKVGRLGLGITDFIAGTFSSKLMSEVYKYIKDDDIVLICKITLSHMGLILKIPYIVRFSQQHIHLVSLAQISMC